MLASRLARISLSTELESALPWLPDFPPSRTWLIVVSLACFTVALLRGLLAALGTDPAHFCASHAYERVSMEASEPEEAAAAGPRLAPLRAGWRASRTCARALAASAPSSRRSPKARQTGSTRARQNVRIWRMHVRARGSLLSGCCVAAGRGYHGSGKQAGRIGRPKKTPNQREAAGRQLSLHRADQHGAHRARGPHARGGGGGGASADIVGKPLRFQRE